MDISQTTQPRSDQMNYDDMANGARVTVTITGVSKGTAEQPVNIELAEFPKRPFKPSKSMRRVLVAAWGKDSAAYVGRRMTLYGDPEVKFGGKAVGGIRIAALSHIEKPLQIALTVTRGKRAPFKVQPLTEEHSGLTDAQIAECTDLDQLRAMWSSASTVQQEQINARAAQLTGEVQG